MKAVEYVGRMLPDGHLELPPAARDELHLRPEMQVKVILLKSDESPNGEDHRVAVWKRMDRLRDELSKKAFSLTDALLQARAEERSHEAS